MASEVKTNKVSPVGTTLSVGDSGDTLALAVDDVTGFNVGSDAAGDVLYNDGTDYTRLAKPGTPAGEVLTFATSATAPSWVATSSAGFDSMQFFDASGTWTKPSDITKVIIFVTGGGGGSGGGDSYGGAGGGGCTAIRFINSGLGATEVITIGAGGTAGSAGGSGSNGGAGQTSSFGSHATAGGGSGSSGNNGGAGSNTATGVVSGVDAQIAGSPGGGTADSGGSFWGGGASNNHITPLTYGTGAASTGPSSAAGKQGCIWVLEYK